MSRRIARTIFEFSCDGWCRPRCRAEVIVEHRAEPPLPKGWRKRVTHQEERPDRPVPDNDYHVVTTVRHFCAICKREEWPRKTRRR